MYALRLSVNGRNVVLEISAFWLWLDGAACSCRIGSHIPSLVVVAALASVRALLAFARSLDPDWFVALASSRLPYGTRL